MDAKHKLKKWQTPQHLRLLELEEVEDVYFEEDFEPNINVHNLEISENSYLHSCPRCATVSRISGEHPYCPDCNWDSLTDIFSEGHSWAA